MSVFAVVDACQIMYLYCLHSSLWTGSHSQFIAVKHCIKRILPAVFRLHFKLMRTQLKIGFVEISIFYLSSISNLYSVFVLNCKKLKVISFCH